MTSLNIAISGAAVVCCPHDRAKREVITETQVAELGLAAGHIYDPKQHKVWLCACCMNLFVDPADTPRLCHQCSHPATHALGGPLPTPNERPLS